MSSSENWKAHEGLISSLLDDACRYNVRGKKMVNFLSVKILYRLIKQMVKLSIQLCMIL